PAAPELYPLSLHDALPISAPPPWSLRIARRACGATSSSRPRSIGRLQAEPHAAHRLDQLVARRLLELAAQITDVHVHDIALGIEDRKSTRLNSSHVKISYA